MISLGKPREALQPYLQAQPPNYKEPLYPNPKPEKNPQTHLEASDFQRLVQVQSPSFRLAVEKPGKIRR